MQKFTVAQFIRQFSTNRACFEYLRDLRWPDGMTCPKCAQVTPHHLIEKKRVYSCQHCGTQTAPTGGTIFHKSRTPLTVWFYVIYQMAQTRCGVSAKEIERQTGVTYKAAWRMCQLVRAALAETEPAAFTGTVEADETYVGGKPRYKGQRRPGRPSWDAKQPVFGLVERGGRVRAWVVDDCKRATVMPIIEANVTAGSMMNTDEYAVYLPLAERGYGHEAVRHKARQYVREVVDETTGEVHSVHTNTIEGFWSHLKGGTTSVHKGVSRRYLQRYADEWAFRYSHRNADRPMFSAFMGRIADAGRLSATLP